MTNFQLIQDAKFYNDLYFERRQCSLLTRQRITFFPMCHIRAVCRMCGNEGFIMPFMDADGRIRFNEPDICGHCDNVIGDYGAIDDDEDWEEADDWAYMHALDYGPDEDFDDGGYEASRDEKEPIP